MVFLAARGNHMIARVRSGELRKDYFGKDFASLMKRDRHVSCPLFLLPLDIAVI